MKISPETMKRARLRRGMTLRMMAARCRDLGVSMDESMLARYESGTQPSPARLPVLAEVLGLPDVDALFEAAS